MSIVTPGGGGGGRSRRDQDPGSGAPPSPGQAGRIIRPRAKPKPSESTEDAAAATPPATEPAKRATEPTPAPSARTKPPARPAAKASAAKTTAAKTAAAKTAAGKTTAAKSTPAAKSADTAGRAAAAKSGAAGPAATSSTGRAAKKAAATKSRPATASGGAGGAGGKGPGGRGPGGKGPGGRGPGGRGPAGRSGSGGSGGKRPKSIVNQRQTPWTLIAVTVVIVLFAGGVVAYAVTRGGGGSARSNGDSGIETSSDTKDVSPATASAADIAKIKGIVHKTFTGQQHQNGVIDYGSDSPPFGGKHNQVWAQCTGVVYSKQLANENAVHTLEHGAVWITYRPGLDQKSIDTLKQKVLGNNYMLMTPYEGLKSPISLQSWGYQLFVDSADDPRIDQFIKDLRLNPKTIPEYGASCDQPLFKASESYPGHPQDVG